MEKQRENIEKTLRKILEAMPRHITKTLPPMVLSNRRVDQGFIHEIVAALSDENIVDPFEVYQRIEALHSFAEKEAQELESLKLSMSNFAETSSRTFSLDAQKLSSREEELRKTRARTAKLAEVIERKNETALKISRRARSILIQLNFIAVAGRNPQVNDDKQRAINKSLVQREYLTNNEDIGTLVKAMAQIELDVHKVVEMYTAMQESLAVAASAWTRRASRRRSTPSPKQGILRSPFYKTKTPARSGPPLPHGSYSVNSPKLIESSTLAKISAASPKQPSASANAPQPMPKSLDVLRGEVAEAVATG